MSSESYIIHDQYAVHFLTFTVVVCQIKEPFLLSGFVRDFKKYTGKEII
jgi:hypothetical protein